MPARQDQTEAPGNRVLAALDQETRQRLLARAETVTLEFKQVLFRDGALGEIHFPLNSMVSLLTSMRDGSTVELATIGQEGMVGPPIFLGVPAPGLRQFAVVQVGGQALRIGADEFEREAAHGTPLDRVVKRYVHSLMIQLGQQAACNGLHNVEERCSRWLLTAHDRVGLEELPITQEFLSQMLGVRRPSVTLAASALQRAGLIRYQRRNVAIVNREGLEKVACECYAATRSELERPLH